MRTSSRILIGPGVGAALLTGMLAAGRTPLAGAQAELAAQPAVVADAAANGAKPARQAIAQATDRGLRWLATRQGAKGEYAAMNDAGLVAATSFAGLAFMAGGSLPDHGEYAPQIKACLEFVLASQAKDTGLFDTDAHQGPMYGHGYATLLVAEAYLKTHDPRLKSPLDRAVALLERAQAREGGWRYSPQPRDADVSVTACELNALLAARAAGIHVPDKMIDDAVAYVRRCQIADGGFTYMAGQAGVGSSGFPRSAAALAVLMHAGAKPGADPDLDRAIKYVVAHAMLDGSMPREGMHYFYGIYYAAQILPWLPQGAPAYEQTRAELLKAQRQDGSWSGDFSSTYATANALLVLQADARHLWMDGAR